ncbi:NAD(P)-binding protein [Punctularia strigosozonata HHB-11173 SS5]|uniref:NAD(P)-binding protein n=1 Tax=Punctularia strigosozonata (strain HHB-11173) TaxID=741275 RepID=UPI0004416FA7|nr:NAD(P)-binding protein [Punctularia strigosozonata HHB-11173 SS5]EIN06091.1 NAD(P)-binding protein [Punctularia strigosozonata HHB-11173 SS5]
MTNAPTVWLVSGANRGIGLAIVSVLVVARPDTISPELVTPPPPTAYDLHALAKKHPGSCTSCSSSPAIDKETRTVAEIERLVGICYSINRVLDDTPEAVREHMEVNVIGTLVLVQATYPLLVASTKTPKFILITPLAGSMTVSPPIPLLLFSYCASKAAENWMTRKMHFEYESDGFGAYCLARASKSYSRCIQARRWGRVKDEVMAHLDYLTPAEVANEIVAQIDEATRENAGGQFVSYNGTRLEW